MKECTQHCNWNECQGKPWYPLKEIFFCRYQVMWLISIMGLLQVGEWPISPLESAESDIPGVMVQAKTEAHFTKAVEVVAEIAWRLERTGIAGTQLVEEIEAMGEYLDYQKLHTLARDALNYVNGNDRKRLTHANWKKQRKYRRME